MVNAREQTPQSKPDQTWMTRTCPTCRDNNGWIEVLPATKRRHETMARCPHDPTRIAILRGRVEADEEPPW